MFKQKSLESELRRMLESPNVKKRNNKCVIRGDAQIKLKKKNIYIKEQSVNEQIML